MVFYCSALLCIVSFTSWGVLSILFVIYNYVSVIFYFASLKVSNYFRHFKINDIGSSVKKVNKCFRFMLRVLNRFSMYFFSRVYVCLDFNFWPVLVAIELKS